MKYLILTLLLTACGPRNLYKATKYTETRDLINESLKNQQIPSPSELQSGNISFVDKCKKFISEIPSDWQQGFLEVPENPSEPDGKKINVFYYGQLKAGIVPTVFFNGGPGLSSWGSYKTFKNRLDVLDKNAETSFVYIDQRGNGCSDYYPQGDSPETLERLTHYGSKGIVADAEAVRRKLIGNDQWIAFGQSYGGHIVHRYVMEAPTSLKAALSHANTINDDGYQRIKNRVFSHFRVIKTYYEKFPEDKKAVEVLMMKLTEDVCVNDPESDDSACAWEILSPVAEFLAFTPEWPDLHEWIQAMVKDDELNMKSIQDFLGAFYFGGGNPLNSKRWANKVLMYTDRNMSDMNAENCMKIRDDLYNEKGFDIRMDPLHECASMVQYLYQKRDTLAAVRFLKPDIMTSEAFAAQIKRQTGLQFYIYSGENDQTVPVENFYEEVGMIENYPNVTYTHYMTSGHDGFYTEEDLWQDLIKESKLPGNIRRV